MTQNRTKRAGFHAALALATLSAPSHVCLHAQTPRPADPALAAAVENTVRSIFALDATPGLGVVVIRDSQIVYVGGFGYADVEARLPFTATTPFYIASTTKSFTGLAAAILHERGRWSIDAPLSKYLGDVSLQSPLHPDSITIRALLTHTHGIGDGPIVTRLAYTGEYAGNEELIGLLRAHPPEREGRRFNYGNIGYNVAALAMDAVTGESWKQTLSRLIFQPLGLRSTTAYVSQVDTTRMAKPYRAEPGGFVRRYFAKNDATMQSAGGLITTPADMGRWLEAHINGGRLDGRQILPAKSVAESHKTLVPVSQSGRRVRPVGYGLGWMVTLLGEDTVLMHGGGFAGYASYMSFMPQRRIGVAVMANNSELGGGLAEIVATSIYTTLRDGKIISADSIAAIRSQLDGARRRIAEDRSRRAARSQVLPFPLEAYVGSYVNPAWGRLTLTQVQDRLEARMGVAWSRVEVFDADRNQLRLELFGGGTVATVGMAGDRAATITTSGVEFRREP